MQPASSDTATPAMNRRSRFIILFRSCLCLAACVLALPHHGDFLSVTQQIARIADQRLSTTQSLGYLNLRSLILPDVDSDKMHAAVCRYSHHVHAILVDDQRRRRNDQRWLTCGDAKVHLAVHARNQRAIAVVDLHLREHRPRRHIDRLGTARNRGDVAATRPLLHRERGFLPHLDGQRGRLRNLDLDSKDIALRNAEEAHRAIAAASVHKIAHLDIARRDDPIERSNDSLKSLQLRQPIDIGFPRLQSRLRGVDIGACGRHIRNACTQGLVSFVQGLLRHRMLLDQGRVALLSNARDPEIRLRLLERGLRLRDSRRRFECIRASLDELLVDFRRRDDRKYLSNLYIRSDVDRSALDIAIRARKHRSAIQRPQVSWQGDGGLCGSQPRVDYDDLRKEHGTGKCGVSCFAIPEHTGDDADCQQDCQQNHATGDTELPFGGWTGVRGYGRHCVISSSAIPRLPWMRLYIRGTKNNVANVAIARPPMTARASGAFCSPPSPNPRAMGSMPTIIAKAVMMMGRRRVEPAETAASTAVRPRCLCSPLAKVTSRMEFAVATPIDMMAPMRLGTLKVVCVRNSAQTMPQNAPGRAQMMMNGSSQLW